MAKVFSVEDGNLSNVPITSSFTRTYTDVDLTFTAKPSGDIYKKTDAAAVKQSVKNILMTNRGEKPFLPKYGGNLNDFLFNLSTDFSEFDIEEAVTLAINNYEPRARVLQVNSTIQPDYNSVAVEVTFQIVSTSEVVTTNISLTRLR
jgi:phage baseplate assembly protein W